MFFLVRSAVCIGLVVSALPNAPGSGAVAWTLGGSTALVGPTAVAALDRFCRDNAARCLLTAQSAMEPGRPTASGGRKLRTTGAGATSGT